MYFRRRFYILVVSGKVSLIKVNFFLFVFWEVNWSWMSYVLWYWWMAFIVLLSWKFDANITSWRYALWNTSGAVSRLSCVGEWHSWIPFTWVLLIFLDFFQLDQIVQGHLCLGVIILKLGFLLYNMKVSYSALSWWCWPGGSRSLISFSKTGTNF